ncbi:MAG: AlpA family transcriptional regulator [Rhodocyclaceae bacterium]|nr:AlpA family transcriptional regulator [Rhodocyclaceae bacterium]
METQVRKFIRLKQVRELVSLSRTTLYEKIKRGEFPKSYPLGARAQGFLASEVDAWIAAQVEGASNAKS